MNDRARRIALVLGAALALAAPAAHAGPSCTGSHLFDQTLATGARWQLCWDTDRYAGVLFDQIYYTPPNGPERKVLAQGGFAQVHVPYDDNGARFHDVTDYGLGDGGTVDHLQDLTASDCPGGTLLKEGNNNSKDVLCRTVRPRGFAYHAATGAKLPGTLVELFSVSAVGAYNYIPTWRFLDDGAIEIAVGATGTLQRFINNDPSQAHRGWPLDSASNRIGVSHQHNYYFRLDFDLGGTPNDDVFERIEEIPDGSAATRTKTITAFTSEGADDVSPDTARSWRVRDGAQNSHGHPISYQLVPLESGHRDVGPSYEPFTENAIYVTRYKSNERYISHNDNDNQFGGSAPNNVTEFIAPAESLGGADIVVYYGIQFHHIPRDEDEAKMHAHWSTFRLTPRDWHDSTLPEPAGALPLGIGALTLFALAARRDRRRR
jgi:Cu2+-containing amine oxidase